VHSEVFFKVYIPIFACQFCDRKGGSLYGLMRRKLLRVVIEIDLVFSLYRVAINCEI